MVHQRVLGVHSWDCWDVSPVSVLQSRVLYEDRHLGDRDHQASSVLLLALLHRPGPCSPTSILLQRQQCDYVITGSRHVDKRGGRRLRSAGPWTSAGTLETFSLTVEPVGLSSASLCNPRKFHLNEFNINSDMMDSADAYSIGSH